MAKIGTLGERQAWLRSLSAGDAVVVATLPGPSEAMRVNMVGVTHYRAAVERCTEDGVVVGGVLFPGTGEAVEVHVGGLLLPRVAALWPIDLTQPPSRSLPRLRSSAEVQRDLFAQVESQVNAILEAKSNEVSPNTWYVLGEDTVLPPVLRGTLHSTPQAARDEIDTIDDGGNGNWAVYQVTLWRP